MSPRDFLHKNAETQLSERYRVAGVVCSLSTNSEQVLEAARESFLPFTLPSVSVDFSVRFWVDDADRAQPPWPKPYVRGLDHLVFAGFDTRSSMLADLHTRRVIGRFSAGMAADSTYWRMVIFPVLLSVLAGSVGSVELHAACVVKNQGGLLLIGPSRSGKSTLAMALSEAGFTLLSDDRTFCSLNQGKLNAWGIPRPLKLRREAAAWFEELRNREPNGVQNGERVFHCQPNRRFNRNGSPGCEPRLLVFLERQQDTGFYLHPMSRRDVRPRIEMDLMAEHPNAAQKQAKTIDHLLTLPCWHLRYGGRPQVIVEQICKSFLCNPDWRSEGGTA
jgi:hypothetical protein